MQGDTASISAGATGVYGLSSSASSAGDSNGVEGWNSGAGRGVYGQSNSGTGVYGNSKSQYGVWGIGSYGVVAGGTQGGVWSTTANGTGAGVYGQNTGAGRGVHGKGTSGVGVFGESNTQAGVSGLSNGFDGVYGETKSANFAGVSGHGGKFGLWGLGSTGVYGQSNDGGFAVQANGNAGQSRSGGGWIKAMALIGTGGADNIGQCFNSQVRADLALVGDCGMGYTAPTLGTARVYLGFDLSDRFVTVMPFKSGGDISAEIVGAPGADGWVTVRTFYTSVNASGNDAQATWAPFYIVVF
jgi:hypothetical protein